jgi:hypothetical protein
LVWVIAATLATACGGTEEGGLGAGVQSYQAARAELADAVTAYQGEAGAAQATDDCRAAEGRYGAAAGPALERMRQLSGELSGGGHRMQMMSGADLACGVEAMTAELARHRGIACAGDAIQNRAEAEHHIGQMGGWLEQQRQRCQAMDGDGAAQWACHANEDGTYGMHCGEEDWMGCMNGTCPGTADGTCPLGHEPGACQGTCGGSAGDCPYGCDGSGSTAATEPAAL